MHPWQVRLLTNEIAQEVESSEAARAGERAARDERDAATKDLAAARRQTTELRDACARLEANTSAQAAELDELNAVQVRVCGLRCDAKPPAASLYGCCTWASAVAILRRPLYSD